MANDAINTNPDQSDLGITTTASNWLWFVFAAMLVSDLVMIAWSFTLPKGRRAFHHLSIVILTSAAIAYFSMASNLGQTPVRVEFRSIPFVTTRAFWYVRYIDWVITTPALLLTLLLTTGLSLSDILTVLFFDEVMIVTGLIGGLVVSSYKWGFFAFGCAAFLYISFILLVPALRSATTLGDDFKKAYVTSAIILAVLWTAYPIAWGLSEGANVISPNGEMYFYGVLDFLAKPVYTFFHVYKMSRVDYTKMQLQSGKYSEGASLYNRENELSNINKNRTADAGGAYGVANAHHGVVAPRGSDTTAVHA